MADSKISEYVLTEPKWTTLGKSLPSGDYTHGKPASHNNVVFTFSHVAVYTLGDAKVLVRQTWGADTFSGVAGFA